MRSCGPRPTNFAPAWKRERRSTTCCPRRSRWRERPRAAPTPKSVSPETRRDAYAADILYGTNHEFGFDYLRDNMARSLADCVQHELSYAIVDEVDNILIDEARTPLIISGPAEENEAIYRAFARVLPLLRAETDYEVDEKQRVVTLTDAGTEKIERALGITNIYSPENYK